MGGYDGGIAAMRRSFDGTAMSFMVWAVFAGKSRQRRSDRDDSTNPAPSTHEKNGRDTLDGAGNDPLGEGLRLSALRGAGGKHPRTHSQYAGLRSPFRRQGRGRSGGDLRARHPGGYSDRKSVV